MIKPLEEVESVEILRWRVMQYCPILSRMSVLRFAEDFSRLVMRYMKQSPLNKNKSTTVIVPLTDDQIAFTVHHVLRALGVKGVDDDTDDDSVVNFITSNKDIAVASAVSNISKINDIKNNDFQDGSQSAVIDFNTSLSDTSLKGENEMENSINILQNEKKFISRSNPTICVNIGRSDTFVRKEEEKTIINIQEDLLKNSLSNNLLQSLEEIRESVLNITLKLDDLKTQTFPQLDKTPQQLNTLLNFDTSMIKKGPIRIRRSMTTFSGSSSSGSASSKLQVAVKANTLADRRKSTGGMACGIMTPKKSGSTDHSVSNLNESVLSNKISPGSVPKLTKNPKYAHVKSTIPKPISLNKKKGAKITLTSLE